MSALLMNAQITLTQSNYAPVPGDMESYKYLDSVTILPKSSGANQTWDYSNAVTVNTSSTPIVITYTTASSVSGAYTFTNAGANIAGTGAIGSQTISAFLKSTSTALEYLGTLDSYGNQLFYSNSEIIMQFPFSYGSNYTDTYSGTYGSMNINGTVTVTGDAYGTVILPSNPNLVFNNVLRVKKIHTNIFSGSVSGTIITVDYEYYRNGKKQYFFGISYQYRNGSMFGPPDTLVDISYDASLVLNVQEISASNPAIFVYPNPSKDVLNIQMNKTDYKFIKIIDIQGKLVKEISINNGMDIKSIDIKDLQTGEYVLLMNNSASGLKDISYKFIKE